MCNVAVIETATWLLHYGCYRDGDMAIAMWLLSRRRHGYCIVVVIETDCNVVVIETAYYAVSTGWGKNKWCYYRVFRIQGLGMGRRIPNEVAAVSR